MSVVVEKKKGMQVSRVRQNKKNEKFRKEKLIQDEKNIATTPII